MSNFDEWFPFLKDFVVPAEGGYTRGRTNARGKVIDPETIFGVTQDVFIKTIPTLSSEEIDLYPASLRAHILKIQQAKPEDCGKEVSALMREAARALTPQDAKAKQSNTGTPVRSIAAISEQATEAQQELAQATATLTMQLYFKHYIEKPGFADYPAGTREQVADFSINAGQPRARWLMVEAMHKAHILSDEEYKTFPVLTVGEACNRSIFKKGAKGEAYNSLAMNRHILEALEDATPEQLKTLQQECRECRKGYYNHLGQSADFKPSKAGWLNRLEHLSDYLNPEKKVAAPRPKDDPRLKEHELDMVAMQYHKNIVQGEHISFQIPGIEGFGDLKLKWENNSYHASAESLPPGVTFVPEQHKGDLVSQTIPAKLRWKSADGVSHVRSLPTKLIEDITDHTMSASPIENMNLNFVRSTTSDGKHLDSDRSVTVVQGANYSKPVVIDGTDNIRYDVAHADHSNKVPTKAPTAPSSTIKSR